MKNIAVYVLAMTATCLLIPGCSKPGCVGGAGAGDIRSFQLGEFTEIRVEDKIDLELQPGIPGSISISGPRNLIADISSDIVDGKLTLRREGSCSWLRDPSERVLITLGVGEVQRLEYEGSGRITNKDTLRLQNFVINSDEGAGTIELTMANTYTGLFVNLENAATTLHGRSVGCNTYTNSRGSTDLSDFVVQNMVIEYGGLADTYIHVTDNLDAINFYKGTIYYRGDPVVSRNIIYASGRIIRIP